MRRLVIVIGLALGLLSAPAEAETLPLVHVRSNDVGGAVSHGSGIAIGGDLVITARHVLSCGDFDSVQWGDVQMPARAVHSNPGLDLALLRVTGLDAPSLELAEVPRSGLVAVLGIRSSEETALLRWADGLGVGLEARRSPGDSGGPILAGGVLLGVVTGAAGGALGQGLAIGPGPEAIGTFLQERRRIPCGPRDRRIVRALSDAQRGAEPQRGLTALRGMQAGKSAALRRTLAARRARLLVLLDALDDAEQVLTGQLLVEPLNARIRLDRLRVQLIAGKPVRTADLLAVASQPESGLLLRMLADGAERSGRPAEGIAVVDRLIVEVGPLPHLLAARCRARTLFGDLAGAIQDCESAIAEDSRPLWALLDLASAYLALRDPASALPLLDEAASRADGAPVRLLRAGARLAAASRGQDGAPMKEVLLRGGLADADAVLQAATASWMRGPAWFLRGVALVSLGDGAGAREAADRAALESPDEARITALSEALMAGAPILGIDGTGHLLVGSSRTENGGESSVLSP